jgi:DNA-binding NarL/FixJ family response regulator
MALIRVVIADDHALFREGLRSLLRLQPDVTVVAELERADALVSRLESTACDVLLLDLQMERAAFVDIEELAARVAVVVVTATESIEDAVAVLRAGAHGLVFKRFALETLMTAIRTVMDGHEWWPPSLQTEIANRLREPLRPH